MAEAFALKLEDGSLDLKTLFDTERGVKVNALWKMGLQVTKHWTDEMISETFRLVAEPCRMKIVKVVVTEKTDG